MKGCAQAKVSFLRLYERRCAERFALGALTREAVPIERSSGAFGRLRYDTRTERSRGAYEDALREQEVKQKEFGPYAGVDQEGHYSHSEAAQQERTPMQEKEVEGD